MRTEPFDPSTSSGQAKLRVNGIQQRPVEHKNRSILEKIIAKTRMQQAQTAIQIVAFASD
jgi:hypothetical protein